MITTAGDDSAGIAFEIHSFLEKLLTGEGEDDSFFCAMYTVDPEDDWQSPTTWQKCNPSWGVSVDPRALAEEAKRAQQIPGARANFRIKHLCEWVQNGGDTPFLDDRTIKRCYDALLDEKQFEGQPCALACDLASRLDMCSVSRVHSRRGTDKKVHHYVFVKSFLPEEQRRTNVAYAEWEQHKELVFTVGTTTDQDFIENHIVSEMETYSVRDIGFDPIQSSMLVRHLEKRGGVMLEVAQSAKYLTPGVLELQESITDGRFHTNSQVLIWALGNLRMKNFGSNMLQPARPSDHKLKIDAAVATIMALRSVGMIPLDESKRAPHVFSIDWNANTVEDLTEKIEAGQ
jgi:phage terminase large subunit-like protein